MDVPSLQKFYFPEIAKPSLPKRAPSTSTQQEAQFNWAMTAITIKHDLSTAAAPTVKSCPKITQRNKRTLRVLTFFFFKDHEIYA